MDVAVLCGLCYNVAGQIREPWPAGSAEDPEIRFMNLPVARDLADGLLFYGSRAPLLRRGDAEY